MPIIQKFVENALGKQAERGVDPMECVSVGAAIQGAVLAGDINDIVLLDVTPLTLGLETLGSVSTPLIDRNTTVPVKKKKIFSTAADMQTAVTINVLQGERPMAQDNTSLGMFNLTGIPPAPRGVPQIEVTFDIDANGILTVSAKDLGTNKEQKITITASTKLSDEEINRMVKEAKAHEEEDKKKKELIENRNALDTMIYTTEKSLSELQDKLQEDEKKKIEDALKTAKEVLDSEDSVKLKQELENLSKVMQEIGTAIYQRNAPQQNASQEGQESNQDQSSEEPTVDADFTEEPKKK